MFPGLSLLSFVLGLNLRPYVPPALDPEPAFAPSHVTTVEVVPQGEEWDAPVFARPLYTAPLVGNVARGARVRVRGELHLPYAPYCHTDLYYALEPFGWLCSADAEPTDLPPSSEPVLSPVEGTAVPYRYAMVSVPEGSTLPMWSSAAQVAAHAEPERLLGRGDTLALDPAHGPTTVQVEGVSYWVTADAKIVPVEGTFVLKKFSTFQGVQLTPDVHLPFAWVTPNKAAVYDAPGGNKIEQLERRTRVEIFAEEGEGRARWVQIGEGRYMKADHLNEVRVLARPEGTGRHAQWIDVDLGEQVVVLYEQERPVYATLTSSGRPPNATPRGDYPVWGKASAVTMKSQSYDDSPYYVNRVPWAMFFQAHNALHAAYWHDRFGAVKSHGCANLSPLDARTIFDWLEPKLPPGWTSVRYWDLTEAPVVHVRNSQRATPFVQERSVGPPDKTEEAERLLSALNRRETAAREAAVMAGQPVIVAPLVTPIVVTPRPPLVAPAPLVGPAPLVAPTPLPVR